MINSFWDERYSQRDFVYGESPNVFFAETLNSITPGVIILPCDGEGRNAVYAAKQGWEVKAFDLSEAGKHKANQLALEKGVYIDFQIMDASIANYPAASADLVALVYAHLPPELRKALHANIINWLKPGGKVILEVFSPQQLGNTSGGPKDLSMLYTKEILSDDFKELHIDALDYVHIELAEGKFHEGPADVVRMIATKK